MTMEMGANFNGEYRYTLFRQWDEGLPPIVFVMLNPSVASDTRDDATVRRCIYYAKRWGYGRLEVRNLFALVSTNPRALKVHRDPIGEHNNAHILQAVAGNDVVAAWGNHGALFNRAASVIQLIVPVALNLWHLGPLTKSGHPHHPLRLANDVERMNWSVG